MVEIHGDFSADELRQPTTEAVVFAVPFEHVGVDVVAGGDVDLEHSGAAGGGEVRPHPADEGHPAGNERKSQPHICLDDVTKV